MRKDFKNKFVNSWRFFLDTKIKKGISVVLMVFGLVLITQGWFPKEKEMVKNAFQKMEKK
ncbi:hypothetical protein B4N84_21870 [Flavobacterium sp. IR1]|nr:hypothetical protein B4N84_21870 [Flavobacterium sp. IR1]